MPFLPEIKAGNWYWVVKCPSCGFEQALGPAPSPQQDPTARPLPSDVRCDCGNLTHFLGDEIERLEAERSAVSAPNVVFHFRRTT